MRYGGKKLAPINIARSAAESAAPWAWRDLNLVVGVEPWRRFFTIGGSGRFDLSTVGRSYRQDGQSVDDGIYVNRSFPFDHGVTINIWADLEYNSDGHFIRNVVVEGNQGNFTRATTSPIRRWRFNWPGISETDSDDNFLIRNELHLYTLSWDYSTVRFYRDGALFSTASASTSGGKYTVDHILTHTSDTGLPIVNDCPQVTLSGRPWSASEIAEHYHDPFAPFRRRPILVPVSSGGGATGVDASSGSLHLTAHNAGVTAGTSTPAREVFTPGIGLHSIASGPIASRRSTQFSASLGTLQIAGQAASVNAKVQIAAAVGALQLTGQAASVRAEKDTRLTATAGSLQLQAHPATVSTGQSITATAGSLALTGQAAGVNVRKRIGAGVGSLLLSGQAASIRIEIDTRIDAALGMLHLTGRKATVATRGWQPESALTGTVWSPEGSQTSTWTAESEL